MTAGVVYSTPDTATLRMDAYVPTDGRSTHPALIFYAQGAQRANPTYMALARIAAAHGIVGIVADLRPVAARADFTALLDHLTRESSRYAIDTSALAAFGASSNGENLLPLLQDAEYSRVKAAVIFYSGAAVREFRLDLPVLVVRSGLDRPFVKASIDSMAARGLAQNAPLTVINHSGGSHGFESTDDDPITRDLIDQTLAFVKRTTARPYQATLVARMGRARAAAQVMAGDFGSASRTYDGLVRQDSTDARLHLALGESLLADGQVERACREFGKLRGRGLLPRELGLPAARACLLSGDADQAIAWLQSIPRQYLPDRVKDDPAFAVLRERADFVALFARPR